MSKQLFVDPNELRKPGYVRFQDIPVNQYQKKVKDELGNFTKEQFINIYRDMLILREFETMINLIKKTGEYEGIAYNHPGPAHLSMGQEAAAVGEAFHLDTNDFIFGSHRAHSDILAKGLSAIAKLSDEELLDIMENFLGGSALAVVEKHPHDSVKDLAMDFLLYGAMSEIFARETGFNRGLGGSMHTFFTPFGIYPNNAIVGGSGTISMGAALYKRVNRKPGIVVANIGDGSLGRGPVLEALNMAGMGQLTHLWREDMRGGLPVLFNIFNNHYGMGGQTSGETMAFDILARMGAGFNPNQMHAERVDGFNPLAVIEAYSRKKEILLKGEGPVLLDVMTYRFAGHSPSDSSSYRTEEEIAAWEAQDPLVEFRSQLIEAGVATEAELDQVVATVKATNLRNFKLSIDDNLSPHMDLKANPDEVADMMFTNGRVESFGEGESDVNMPLEENPRVKAIARKERFGMDANGKLVPKNRVYQLRDGLFEAIIDRFYKDPSLVSYGEDVRDWGGAFAVYRGLTEALPYHRLFNSPISESAIVGSAVGYAMAGGRALVELMYCDFLGCAGDEVFNQMAKWQAMSANVIKLPVTLRVSVGSKYGAQHSQDWTALTAHIPGLKVVFPASPYDAKGMMATALVGTDPVVFFESQRIYDVGELFHEGGVPAEYYEIPFGKADVKRPGKDITILTFGAVLYRAIEAADTLKEKYGLEAEIIDARSLVPFDYDTVLESVKKTGRLVIVTDACERGSFASEVARQVTEMAFDELDAPPVVVASKNWITPAHELEDAFFPQPAWILDAIDAKILPLPGHVRVTNQTLNQKLINERKGV
ncbi:MAG: alpha-ketoacid dehydrogenase subunit alpha/beta [Candidatus Excrementavichristensenella sp.]|jgi:2-oxoisovalerate dehydrogenase E1 component|nr:thiamine pyrophosphate-dependent enzyme [Bacillota bacterium]NLL55555.1 dehydrogenase [Clostridiales bacterium]